MSLVWINSNLPFCFAVGCCFLFRELIGGGVECRILLKGRRFRESGRRLSLKGRN